MKTIYLTLGVLLTGVASAQYKAIKTEKAQFLQTVSREADPVTPVAAPTAGSDTIASFDFSSGGDYTLSSTPTSPVDAEWQLGAIDDFQKGYAQEINSPTKANGYGWCSGIKVYFSGQPYNDINTSLTLKPLDLSAYTAVTLRFFQHYKPLNYDDCFVQFSTNGGASWLSTQINGGAADGFYQMNLPAGVPGSPAVLVRFTWTSTGSPTPAGYGSGYGWQIDDVSLIATPAKELAVTDVLFDGGDDSYIFYHKELPLSQSHMFKPIIHVYNNGAATQSIKVIATVKKDGVYYGEYSNTPFNLAPLRDSNLIFSTFQPTVKGHYEVSYQVTSPDTTNEINTGDNIKTEDFYITDFVYSDNAGSLWKKNQVWGAWREQGNPQAGYAELSAAQGFQVFNPGDKAYGVTTVFPSGNPKFDVDQALYFELLRFKNPANYGNGFSQLDYEVLASKEVVVSANDTTPLNSDGAIKYVHVYFDDAITLNPGLYIATINSLGGTSAYNLPVYEGGSNRDASGSLKGAIQGGASSTSYTTWANISPFIKLNLSPNDPATGISKEEAYQFVLGQNQPNPWNGLSTIPYTLSEGSDVSFVVTDLSGKVIQRQNRGTQAAGQYSIELNSTNFNAGLYFYTLTVNGKSITKKMMINE